MHHAHSKGGWKAGMSVYPDITFITHYMERWYGYKRFLIVDLDAHQGNGHARDHMNRIKYCIFDMYNHEIYPSDDYAKQGITYDIDASLCPDDESYLAKLREMLPIAFNEFNPDFVIYNAGTDCMNNDPLGHLQMTDQGIIRRDEFVFKLALEVHKVPIVMLLSGGFCHVNAPCIAQSIANLKTKFNLNTAREERKLLSD